MGRALTQMEALALLREQTLGRLGCVEDDGPYVVPINYVYEAGYIYSHCLPGRKLSALRHDKRVCLQVDSIKDAYTWQSVIAFGDFEEVTNKGEKVIVLGKFLARLPNLTPVESHVKYDSPIPVIFRIKVNSVTGVAEGE